MTQEEMIQLLHDKLTISVSVCKKGEWDSETTYTKVKVSLYFDDVLISESSDYA